MFLNKFLDQRSDESAPPDIFSFFFSFMFSLFPFSPATRIVQSVNTAVATSMPSSREMFWTDESNGKVGRCWALARLHFSSEFLLLPNLVFELQSSRTDVQQ